ncbi:hypothetical protein SEA_KARP_30 [Streptomyces phage Karp]|nr:hypothetical protein SEA_KARP_30 [Streptomyces phage Karp]
MSTPVGPITVEITTQESGTVQVSQTPAPGLELATNGPQGAPGTRIYQTNGQPSNSVGLAGDYALDTATGRLYGPKGSVWTSWAQIPGITETGWHENGQAEFNGSDIYLTSAGGGFGAGTLWYGTSQASNAVDVTFELEMSGGSGADGITFAFADTSTANTFVGGGGGELGIVGVNSVAVAFVTAPDEKAKIVTTTPTGMTTVVESAVIDLRPNPVTVRIKYNGTKLTVWIDGTQVFDQTISIPANSKLGFTAANGGSDDNHIIRNVSFVPSGGMLLKGEKGDTGNVGSQGIAGTDGEPGPANTLSIGTVTTGTAGSSASASVTGTSPNQTLNLTIPKGDKGDTGNTGATGTNNTTIVRKTADEQVTNSTTVQDDDHFVIAVEANSTYAIDSFMMFESDAAADIKFTFTGPAGSTIYFTSDGVSAGNSNNIGSVKMDANAGGAETVLGGFVGTRTTMRPAGIIVTGGTAGSLTFRWAQNALSATPTTLYANSWLRIQKMA